MYLPRTAIQTLTVTPCFCVGSWSDADILVVTCWKPCHISYYVIWLPEKFQLFPASQSPWCSLLLAVQHILYQLLLALTTFMSLDKSALILLAAQIWDFVASGHTWTSEISANKQQIISDYLCSKSSAEVSCQADKSQFCDTFREWEILIWPPEWATDKSWLKRDIWIVIDKLASQPSIRHRSIISLISGAGLSVTPRCTSEETESVHHWATSEDSLRLNMANLTAADMQCMIQETVQAAVAAAMAFMPQSGPPGPLGEPGPPGPAGTSNDSAASSSTSIKSWDISKFNPNPDLELTEIKDGQQIYHNVFAFTNRLHVKAMTMNPALLRNNLDVCLMSQADIWYFIKLNHLLRMSLHTGTGVDKWCRALEAQFRETSEKTMTALETLRYTVKDVHCHWDPVIFVQSIMLHAQNAGTVRPHDEPAQVRTAWEHMDAKLHQNLQCFSEMFTIQGLIADINEAQDLWTDLYSSHYGKVKNQDIFINNQNWDNWFQPQGKQSFQHSSFQSGQQFSSHSFPYSNYPMDNQQFRFPYDQQTHFSYGRGYRNDYRSYDSSNYQQQQQQQPQQQLQIGGLRAPLQITAGNARSNEQNSSSREWNNSKNPFCCDWQPPNQLKQAYHGDAEHSDSMTEPLDEGGQYQAYEDNYYQQTYWQECEDAGFSSLKNYFSQQWDYLSSHEEGHDPADEVKNNHVAVTKLSIECRQCHVEFNSNNRLHRHLCTSCWKPPHQKALMNTKLVSQSDELLANLTASPYQSEGFIRSTAAKLITYSYGFWGWCYATAQVQLMQDGPCQHDCLDTDCTMSLIDQNFLKTYVSEAFIKQTVSPISVHSISTATHQANEYALLTLYLPTKDGWTAVIEWEFHLIDSLKANILIGMDVMGSEDINVLINCWVTTIGSCNDIKIAIFITTSPDKLEKGKPILANRRTIIPPCGRTMVPITGQADLLTEHDLLFESASSHVSVYTHIVDHAMSQVYVRNDSDESMTIPVMTHLGQVVEYNTDGAYLMESTVESLAARTIKSTPTMNWIHWSFCTLLTATAAFHTATSDQGEERLLSNEVTVYSTTVGQQHFKSLVSDHAKIFEDHGNSVDISPEQWMDILLHNNWEELYKPEQAHIYPLGQQNRDVVDEAFDKLQQQRHLSWISEHISFSFLCFVIWKTTPEGSRKGCVVVNIQALNKITMPDTYPIPSQADILAAVQDSSHIFTVNCSSFFYQWRVKPQHHHWLTVSSHQGQETFNVAVMRYSNSSVYIQQMIDRILRPHRAYARVYVDDIVIYSNGIDRHLEHLQTIFATLARYNICLSPGKSFLGYPSVQLLRQWVNTFDLTTAEDKLSAITQLHFPHTLSALEKYLRLTGYLHQYIPRYAAIVKPLQERKTILNWGMTAQGNACKWIAGRMNIQTPTLSELNVFHHLQGLFSRPTMLSHFDPKRQLYIDLNMFKEFSFGAHIYHCRTDQPSEASTISTEKIKQKEMESIMFLSCLLTDAETHYWLTELEIAGLVWVIKKVHHMVETTMKTTIVYTDHSATLTIVRQSSLSTTLVEKLNLCLVQASEYLQRFWLDIHYKAGKTNIISDALSWLASCNRSQPNQENSLDALASDAPWVYVTLVKMNDNFRQRLLDAYNQDPHWVRIRQMVEDNEELEHNAAALSYKMIRGLIYFNNVSTMTLQLCISNNMEQEVFKLAHDELRHPRFAHTHEQLTEGLYIFNMSKQLQSYLHHCSQCQLNMTPHHRPYGSLQPIITPPQPFHTYTIDFIVALPKTKEGFNSVMSLTDKFSKAVTFIPGKTTWGGKEWASCVIERLALLNWGLPRLFISDCDPHFVHDLWRAIFRALNVFLVYSTAYHPQMDSMSEHTQQTAEIALCHLITTIEDICGWLTVLPQLQATINNSTSSSISISPNEILYEFKMCESLDLLQIDDLSPYQVNNLSPEQPEEVPHPTALCQHINTVDPVEEELAFPADVEPAMSQLIEQVSEPMKEYRPHHIDAKDALAFAVIRHKDYYDAKHQPQFFWVGDEVNIHLHREYKLSGIKTNKKLQQQFVGPFTIIKRMRRLAYELTIPDSWKIHNVISVTHLESAYAKNNSYHWAQPHHPSAIMAAGDTTPEWEVEKLVDKDIRLNETIKYLIRWLGYGPEFNKWYSLRYFRTEAMRRLILNYEDQARQWQEEILS